MLPSVNGPVEPNNLTAPGLCSYNVTHSEENLKIKRLLINIFVYRLASYRFK